MTEEQRKEIDDLKTIPEWEYWVSINCPEYSKKKGRSRDKDMELENKLHTRRFELFKEINYFKVITKI